MENKQFSSLQLKIEQFQNDAAIDAEREEELSYYYGEEDPDGLQNSKNVWENYRDGYYYYKGKYEAIRDASFWKMTKPLRDVSDWIRFIKTGKKKEIDPLEVCKPSLNLKSGTIGVHLHLYYEDLLDEFCEYLGHIPEKFDLFISCRQNADLQAIKKRASQIPNAGRVLIRKTPNRGRDISPFYVLFKNELLQYDFLLHIHTKKSLYTGEEKSEWRHWALNGVLKNKESVGEMLELLRDPKANAGLLFGEMTPTLPPMALHWLYNGGRGKEILKELHLKFENHMLFYPVGSFFWAKTKAIRPLFEMSMTYDSFDEEKGQIDGTLAHALERVIACVVRERKYNMYIFDPDTNQFHKNISYKSFQNYFSLNVQSFSEMLIRDYDVITFDIFDTLITRLIYEPDDLFVLMERHISNHYGVAVDYLNVRKAAEALAWQERGDFCNIHDIYKKLPEVSNFTAAEAEELKEFEIRLEYELCIPRRDILDIYNRVLDAGKTILLISDMYLPSEIVRPMLEKCGYRGYSELWISCERGKRKDRDTIWNDFFDKYGEQRTIHIGDNPHSDAQIVGDRKKASYLLLSPIDQFRFSDQYEKFKHFLDGSPENSFIMGYLVNRCLYNSPFSLKGNGISQFHDGSAVISGLFGPLFLKYMEYLHNTSREDVTFLFLSREGYFLQKLYHCYCKCFGKTERKNVYFLTSRRATSVAQINSYKDAKELLGREYSGNVSTLLSERFGLKNTQLKEDFSLQLPKEAYRVIPELGRNAETILTTAAQEKKNYLSYISELLGTDFDWNQAVLVDVGYSGTIQYYLMKILSHKLDGCYLATAYNMKPDLLDGTYRSLYSFWKSRRFEKTQLFLEAVTAAPHGQVVSFVEAEGSVKAELKPEAAYFGEKAKIMQEYIYEYFETLGGKMQEFGLSFSKELAEAIFEEILRPGILGKECQDMFKVYDGYCMDGEWAYDVETNDWKITQNGKGIYLKSIIGG